MQPSDAMSGDILPEPDAMLEMKRDASAHGATCAILTPAIKAKLRDMAGGQVLKVWVDDPSARDDITAWCRLSGHELLAIHEETPQAICAYLRKKPD